MVGAHGGSSDCVQALLSAGASHSHTDRWERTALHLAVTAGEHGVAPGLLLLHSGADPFVEDCKGVSVTVPVWPPVWPVLSATTEHCSV